MMAVVHLLGFAGSALIVTGVMMRPVIWLRAFGLAGASTFIVYGILLGAWPVVVTNVATAGLHVFHLRARRADRQRPATTGRPSSTPMGRTTLPV